MTPPPAARPPLTFIVAVARNGVMGKDGKLPWDLPEDRAFFRDMTMGHAIIMGHKTWDERGAPLPGRRNIVVSRSGAVSGEGREVVGTIGEAIALASQTDPDPYVVGGGEIFKLAFPYATRILLHRDRLRRRRRHLLPCPRHDRLARHEPPPRRPRDVPDLRAGLDQPFALANAFICSARAWQPSRGMAL